MSLQTQIADLDAQRSSLTADYNAAFAAYEVSINHLLIVTVAEQGALAVDTGNWQAAKSAKEGVCWTAAPKPDQTALSAETNAYETAVHNWTVSTYQPWRVNEPGYLTSRAAAEQAFRASYPRPLYQQQLAAYASRDACVASWVSLNPDPVTAFRDRDRAQYNTLVNAWQDTHYPPYVAQYNALSAQRTILVNQLNSQLAAAAAASAAGQTQQPSNSSYAAGNARDPSYSGQTASSGARLPAGAVAVYGQAVGGNEASSQGHIVGYLIPIAGTGGWVEELRHTTAILPSQPYIPPRPAVAAVAGQIVKDYNLGWNASARSMGAIYGNGEIRFVPPASSIDIFVGLANEDTGTGYVDLPYAFRFSKGFFYVYSNRDMLYGPEPYSPTQWFGMAQIDGRVYVSLYGGVNDGRWMAPFSEFGVPDNALSGLVNMAVVAYAAGDMIHYAEVNRISVGAASMMSLKTYASDDAYAAADNQMLYATVDSYFASYSHAAMPAATGRGADHAYGEAQVAMLPATIIASAGQLQTGFAFGDNATAYMLVGGSGQSGGIGSADLSVLEMDAMGSGHRPYRYSQTTMRFATTAGGILPFTVGDGAHLVLERMEMPADYFAGARNYAEVTVSMLPFTTAASAFEGATQAWMQDTVLAADPWFVRGQHGDSMLSIVQVAPTFLYNTLFSDDVRVTVFLADTMSAAPHYVALMFTTVAAGITVPAFFGDTETWVMNAVTNANSRYEGFDFNSYALIGGEYYGAMQGGLFKLSGDTDDGAPIRASINFGNQTFGTSSLKGCTNAYVGMSSSGELFLKVTAEGNEYIYRARDYSSTLQIQRFDTGRGLRANYLQFELYSDGADFDISSVEFLAVPLSRRI